MLQLIKFLIFGHQCCHKWILLESMKPYSNSHKFLYTCSECGKFKKVKLETATNVVQRNI